MKNRIFLQILSVLVVSSALVFTGCEEENDYDFSKIEPIIRGLTGPNPAVASGLVPSRYSVHGRTGSTYEFVVSGWTATVADVAGYPFMSDITFQQSDNDTECTITVTETTKGGIVSDPVTMTVTLLKFKPLAKAAFIGDWTAQAGGSESEYMTFPASEVSSTETTVTVLLEADATGLPALMTDIYSGWGELFQPGFGNEGSVEAEINLLDGSITIPLQYWGETLPGPWDYWIDGSGTWDGFSETATLSYTMQFADDGSDPYVTYTTVFDLPGTGK